MKRENEKDLKSLSKKEEEIMSCFWKKGALFVREVVEMLPDPKPHFNTVSTFVRGLESKGWLAHETFGSTYRYFPVVEVSEYRRTSLSKLVNHLFGNSYLSCVSALLKDEKISVEELRELIEEVEKQRPKTEEK